MRVSILLTIAFTLIVRSSASPGDTLDEFVDCVDACETRICQKREVDRYSNNQFNNFPFESTSPILKLLLWDCPSNCDYQCQQAVTEIRSFNNEEIHQFHGKWPFKRLLYTQELASSFFSLLNFIPHYLNFKKFYKLYERTHGSLKILYFDVLIVAVVAQCAWIFSTIFHIRDLIVTERLDYFFAGATVLSGFYSLTIRVFRFDKSEFKRIWFSRFCILLYLYHFTRLNWDWSYTYNMQANITIAILQYTLFIVLAYQHYKNHPEKKSLYLTPIFLILSVLFGMSFEIFDFINLSWQVDAHAIWHLTTIIPSFYLYDFFLDDIKSLSYTEKYID